MFSRLHHIIIYLIDKFSIEYFVFFASFLEEILPPLPMPSIMVFVGSFANFHDYSFLTIFNILIISLIGKVLGAIILYNLAYKLEIIFIERFGSYFGINESNLLKIGNKLGKGKMDYVIFSLISATPIFPSTIIPICCGLIKMPNHLFLTGITIGFLVRNSIYLYLGYTGAKILFKFY